ncbi:MAG: BT4734/BF3469 family protein [Candidatus Cloacimonetes bacterium]|nr:BT4734/BF3469 family protein [Candidatus Cloacimonadota bacterium]
MYILKNVNTNILREYDFSAFVEDIKKGLNTKIKKVIEIIRQGGEEAKELKKSLPCHVFNKVKVDNDHKLVRKKDFFESADTLVFDYDNVEKIEEKKAQIEKDDETFLCYITPSGKGLRVLYRLKEKVTTIEDYKKIYQQVATIKDERYGLQHDSACSDPLRASYVSYDSQLIYNPDCKKINTYNYQQAKKGLERSLCHTTPDNEDKNESSSDTEKIVKFLTDKINNYDEWLKICFSLCNVADGKRLFVQLTANNPNYQDSEAFAAKFFDDACRSHDSLDNDKINLSTLYYIAYKYGYRNFDFYEKSLDENGVLTGINLKNSALIMTLLPAMGIFKYGNEFILKTDRILERIEVKQIKNIVIEYIKNDIKEEDNVKRLLIEKIFRSTKSLFTSEYLDYLPIYSGNLKKDTEFTSCFFFRNKWVLVSKEKGIEIKDYADLNADIFSDQIIEHDIEIVDNDGDFQFFLENVCCVRKERTWVLQKKRIKRLMGAIGYLLNRFKKPSNAKAVIIMDEINLDSLDFDSTGGTGKSLIGLALSKVRKVRRLDGKQLRTDSQFIFQSVQDGDEIVLLDDIRRNFDFEAMFPSITGDLLIERKNRNPININFEDSPKFLITSNRVVNSTGDSTERRKIEILLSHYYDASYTPYHDSGRDFFISWDESEWTKFYNCMLECSRIYHESGVIKVKTAENVTPLVASTCSEFVFFAEKNIEKNIEYNKSELFELFLKENMKLKFTVSSHKFTKWLQIYAAYKNYEHNERKSNSRILIKFSDKK